MINNKSKIPMFTHPIFDIDGLDWLCEHLSTTPAKLDNGHQTVKIPDYSSWQEQCACIGMIPSPPARALCSLLVWGNDKQAFDMVLEYLSGQVLIKLQDKQLPKGCTHTRQDLAYRLAYMVWHLHLWNVWDLCTVKGRLYFAGIMMSDKTYTNQMLPYQRTLLETLAQMTEEIEISIAKYKKALLKENTA